MWETRLGDIPLRMPKVRDGTCFPTLVELWRRSEKALLAAVRQAYVEGLSTRRVDDAFQALGLAGIDKCRVSRICKELDEVVERFRPSRMRWTRYGNLARSWRYKTIFTSRQHMGPLLAS